MDWRRLLLTSTGVAVVIWLGTGGVAVADMVSGQLL